MYLRELIKDICGEEVSKCWEDLEISSICCDSRKVTEGSLFVVLQGENYDGADFIEEAIKKGARVVVGSLDMKDTRTAQKVCFLRVEDAKKFLRDVVARFYGKPSSQVKVVGVTGTNGKTTITYLIESILRQANQKCEVVGTINNQMIGMNTTLGFLENQQLLFEFAQKGIDFAVMEVSSHGLDQGRVDHIDFSSAVFTNLTEEHLDYHKTLEAYFLAKAKLFQGLSTEAVAVINLDDAYGKRLEAMTTTRVLTYGIDKSCDVMARDLQMTISGSRFEVVSPQGKFMIETFLIGLHNIYNILAATCVALTANVSVDKIIEGIKQLKTVSGRLEKVESEKDFRIFIDYAHTPDALKNVLETIKAQCSKRIILVFGCGGNRDQTKRAVMGGIASRLADISIVTNDNPRGEDPDAIINQIIQGFENHRYEIILQREEAIVRALKIAQKDDVVLLAGKGHETYQIFKDKTISFDEREIIKRYLKVFE